MNAFWCIKSKNKGIDTTAPAFDVYLSDQLSLACTFGLVSLQLGPIGQAKARNGL